MNRNSARERERERNTKVGKTQKTTKTNEKKMEKSALTSQNRKAIYTFSSYIPNSSFFV